MRMNDRKQKKRAAVPQDPSKPLVNCAFDELVALEKLVPNPRNPNQHPQSQVALLAKVIAHQGWRSPVVVSTRSGFIVAGHGRYEAAKVLGLSAVPVDYQDFATEADEWAHLVADNRLAELAEADESALKGLLAELKAGDFDLDLAGFDAAALEALLADPPQPEAPDEFPEVDEDIPTDFQCPKCSYRWSGKAS
jgi:ParB-like chromosome segregation protein Spo0J